MQRHLASGIESKCQQNTKRIWPYSSSRSSKVIDLGVNGKPMCDFILVINSNFSRICYRSRDIYSRLKIENCWFYPPLPCLTPPSSGNPLDIDVIYTPLKSAFNGLQLYAVAEWYEAGLCDRKVAGSTPARGCCVPTPTQRAIPPGSVNE